MRKKLLLGALFVVLMNNVKALEITENFVNDDFINFENIKDNEVNINIQVNEIELDNNGLIGSKYTEENVIDGVIRQQKGNGLNIQEGVNGTKINNNGIIKGQVKISGGEVDSASKTVSSYSNYSGNGISMYGTNIGPSEIMGNLKNNGIISGSAFLVGGETIVNGSVPMIYRYGNGNGISFFNSKRNVEIGDIINNGIISGKTDLKVNYERVMTYINTHGSGISFYGDVTNILKSGNIINSGYISGEVLAHSLDVISYSANGITFRNKGDVEVDNFINNGYTSGKINSLGANSLGVFANSSIPYSGNGIMFHSSNANIDMNKVENYGRVSGVGNFIGRLSTYAQGIGSGNGFLIKGKTITTKDIKNIGVISGKTQIDGREDIHGYKEYEDLTFSGNGIAFEGDVFTNIENNGIIKGTQSAVAAKSIVGNINNYGVMAGREIFSDGRELIKNGNTSTSVIEKDLSALAGVTDNNQGVYIKLKSEKSTEYSGKNTGKVELDLEEDVVIESIDNGIGGLITLNDGTQKTVLNAQRYDEDENMTTVENSSRDSYMTVTSNIDYNNHVINGAGIKNAVLSVKDGVNLNLNDSIVNGYKTAMSLDNNATVTASNTIFNGGGLTNEDAVIDAKGNNGNLTINGTSIINGIATVSGSNSTVNIGNEVMINGDLTSNKDGNNILNLGDGVTSEELRLFHNIDGFTKINTSGNVTAYETAKISSGDIHVKDGKFVVRVDGTELDDEGRVKGHALYEHEGKITIELPKVDTPSTYKTEDDTPQLVFKASGLGEGTIIAMNGTNISSIYDPQLGTMSIAHTAIKQQDKNGGLTGDIEIAITNFDDIFYPPAAPEGPNNSDNSNFGNNGNFENIYDSIVKGDQLPNLAPTIDTENKTEEDARKGLLTLLDQIYANNPYVQSAKLSKENVGLFREQILSTKMPKENEWIAEGHGIYSIDEYGKSRDVKVGNTAISNNYSNKGVTTGLLGTGEYGVAQDTSLGFAVGGSHQKLDMSMNSKLKGEAIYLGVFGKKKVDNYLFTAGLGYQYGQYDGTRTIMNEYQSIRNTGEVKTDSFDIYGEIKYTFEDEKGRKIEPKLRLSQLFVNEKSVSEKNGALAIDMEKKNYSIPEVEIGVDFIEPINVKSGKLESKVGVAVARTFGKDKNSVTAKMKNSEDFKVTGPDFEDTKLRLSAGVDYEHVNGVFYNANLGVDMSKDMKKEINAKVGIGYRF